MPGTRASTTSCARSIEASLSRVRSIWLSVAMVTAACASSRESGQPSSSSNAAASAAPVGPASATEAETASAKAEVTGPDAKILKRLGGTYLCDQRVYPRGGGAHISAWEWAFQMEPTALANALARELPGSSREELSFGYKNADGAPDVVVTVDGPARSHLGCETIPEGTKSLVVASRR